MRRILAILMGISALTACGTTEIEDGGKTSKWDCGSDGNRCYVRVDSGRLALDGQAYAYMGANYWSAPFVSLETLRTELDGMGALGIRNLRIMALAEGDIPASQRADMQFGPQRITPASSDSPCVDDALRAFGEQLESVLDEMNVRGMKAVLTLNNFWHWSGGMPQYLKWAHEHPGLTCGEDFSAYIQDGPNDPATGQSLLANGHLIPFEHSLLFQPGTGEHCDAIPLGEFVIPHPNTLSADQNNWWQEQQDLSEMFYCNAKAQEFFLSRAGFLVRRLKDHPAIMAWQLANEPRSFRGWGQIFHRWVQHTAQFIKERDPNHLVSTGSEGELSMWGDYVNQDYADVHSIPEIDYLTIHVWPENWGWYDPSLPIDATSNGSLSSSIELSRAFIAQQVNHARTLGKPMVLEEFGLARDARSLDPTSSVNARDRYYEFMFDQVRAHDVFAGVNFWAWAGDARPANNGSRFWRLGDEYIGDPPHEEQGWYSVYASDAGTLAIIARHASEMTVVP